MFALLDPRLWLALLIALAGAYGTGRFQQWRSDDKAQSAAMLKASEAARQKEANWQQDAATAEEVKDEEIRSINAQHLRELAGLSNRSATRLPTAASCAANGSGASPAQLSRPDAEVALGIASDADATAADLRACQAWIKAVKP